MSDKLTVLLLVIVLLAGVGFAAVAFFLGKNVGTNQKDSTSSIPAQSQAPLAVTPSQEPSAPAQSPLPSPTSSSSPESSQTTDVKPGWLTYANSQYGFSISYPEDYKALSDQNNLYGWPNGLVLFYKGGQSYDIAVEVWDSEAAYKQKYPTENPTVYKIGNKFITLADLTKEPENQEIIATFKAN